MHFKDVRACREKCSPSQATAHSFLITQTSVLSSVWKERRCQNMKFGAASGRKEMREARTQHFLLGSVPLAVDFGQEVSSCCQAILQRKCQRMNRK